MPVESPPMHLQTLELTNYRLFAELKLSLHPALTVLVAPNGGGKTAVLDAIGSVLHSFVYALQSNPEAGYVGDEARESPADVRRVLSPEHTMETTSTAQVDASLLVNGVSANISSESYGKPKNGATGRYAGSLPQVAEDLRKEVLAYADRKLPEAPLLPFIGYYGTGRLWAKDSLEGFRSKDTVSTSRFAGYDECLTSSSRYTGFAEWFERYSNEADQERHTGRPSPHQPSSRLESVRKAVDVVLRPTQWHTLEWDYVERTVVASHPEHGRLPVSWLSDGIRNTIGLVADIAHRMARLNPQFGADAARQTPGIVLIDEVDMHLHPEWQQVIIGALREAFPLVQFIVTTHSPQVLSTVRAESIRKLEFEGAVARAIEPKFQTRGVESASVLAAIMDVDPIPAVEEAQWVSRYRALIEDDHSDAPEAVTLREQLLQHFGPTHPVILDCDRLIRLQSFKKRGNSSSSKE